MTKPWERRPGETDKAFAAFCAYRDMGDERTHRKCVILLGKSKGYVGALERWSAANAWGTRCAAFDAHLDSISVATMEAERRKDARDQAKFARLLLKRSHEAMESGALDAKDAAKAGDTAVKLLRLIHGEATERTEVSELMTPAKFRELREAALKVDE